MSDEKKKLNPLAKVFVPSGFGASLYLAALQKANQSTQPNQDQPDKDQSGPGEANKGQNKDVQANENVQPAAPGSEKVPEKESGQVIPPAPDLGPRKARIIPATRIDLKELDLVLDHDHTGEKGLKTISSEMASKISGGLKSKPSGEAKGSNTAGVKESSTSTVIKHLESATTEESSVVSAEKMSTSADAPGSDLFFGDIWVSTKKPPITYKPNIKVTEVSSSSSSEATDPDETLTTENKLTDPEDLLKVPPYIREQITRMVREGSPQPNVPSFGDFMTSLDKLATRALAKGFRQPLNVQRNPGRVDDWSLAQGMAKYLDAGKYPEVNYEDPLDILTHGDGKWRYGLWRTTWNKIKDDYLKESLMPDFRVVLLHKDMSYKLLKLLKEEANKLIKERARGDVFTEKQSVELSIGIAQREYWIRQVMQAIEYNRILQKLLEELPDDAMMAKKWFGNQFLDEQETENRVVKK
ncbi:hypothetical protein TWF730_001677 [Orbilia blumenaviensis]|uniref:Uncharacterized protein n=1 Tax=Orbilia blumenaviensis TaxID=1796055 RepID=A0AAV9ULH2_9PEZI